MQYIRKENTTAVKKIRRLLKSYTKATSVGERDFILSSIAVIKARNEVMYNNLNAWLDLHSITPVTELTVEFVNHQIMVMYHRQQDKLIPYLILTDMWVYKGEEDNVMKHLKTFVDKGMATLCYALCILRKYTVLPIVPALQREGRISLKEIQNNYKGEKHVN